jgi:hypothetical protein
MGGACSTHGRVKSSFIILVGTAWWDDTPLRRTDIDGKIILKCILESGKVWIIILTRSTFFLKIFRRLHVLCSIS